MSKETLKGQVPQKLPLKDQKGNVIGFIDREAVERMLLNTQEPQGVSFRFNIEDVDDDVKEIANKAMEESTWSLGFYDEAKEEVKRE